jgi:hypothetical protein
MVRPEQSKAVGPIPPQRYDLPSCAKAKVIATVSAVVASAGIT